jgi:hypothetical protein
MAVPVQALQAPAGQQTLGAKAKKFLTQRAPNEEAPMKLNHPTMDSPGAAARAPYNPSPPQKRFVFLKRFATVPGLRAKGAALAQQA